MAANNTGAESRIDGNGRGRKAHRPSAIPGAGWKDIAWRVKREINEDNLSVIAAGVAFYGFMSIFPALAALVSVYALVTDPAKLQDHIASVQSLLPPEAAQLITQQLQRIVQSSSDVFGWSLIVGAVLAVWSAAKGMSAIIAALNVVYDEVETRGFLKLNALAVLWTFAGMIFLIGVLFLIVGIPAVLKYFNLPSVVSGVVDLLRWPILAAAGIVALGVLYRRAPDRDTPDWRWITWGSTMATLLWLAGSVLFSYYVTNFGSYNAVYGSLGVVVVLMMWLLVSAYCILLGAEINAEIEHQTDVDSTVGEAEPMGDRGARMADTRGRQVG